MNISDKILTFCKKRNMSIYKLAVESGLTERAIYQWLNKKTRPTIKAIEAICNTLGITLAEFFSEGDVVELTPEVKELFNRWHMLEKDQKDAVLNLLQAFN